MLSKRGSHGEHKGCTRDDPSIKHLNCISMDKYEAKNRGSYGKGKGNKKGLAKKQKV